MPFANLHQKFIDLNSFHENLKPSLLYDIVTLPSSK